MSFLKSLIFVTILVACFAAVFAVKFDTGNDVCKISGKALGNGTQNRDGSCVETFMGEIPNVDHMVSTVLLFPKNNEVIKEKEPFTIRSKTINLKTGFFDDPVTQYYIFPQTLDDNGDIQGHSHVVIQKIEDPNEPPNPEIFAFFKGLNEAADANGELSTLVEKGLPAGDYRCCTMVSSFAHQPTLMPVAQRGAQDDCVRFTVKSY